MSSFAALMALSATQTRQSEAAVQTALAEKQRREAQKRKEVEEKERKEREMEAKLRLKRLEEEKREQERQARVEREREARERDLKRREEEECARLLHGPKKGGRTDSNGYPVSRVGRKGSDDSDDDAGASALTREEKRRRRMELEMRHGTQSGRRSNPSGGYAKAGRRLPGGAVDITTAPGAQAADGKGTMSIRQRLAQAPTLIKLNVNKRDTRTIDEILQDRAKAKAKTLQGDEAKEFKDWFGKAKETKEVIAVAQADSASTSRANTPAASSQKAALAKTQSGSASPTYKMPAPPRHFPSAKGSASLAQRPSATRPLPSKTPATPRSKTPVPLSRAGTATSSKVTLSAGKPAAKKRPRSLTPSRSPSPPPKKRAVPAAPDFSSEIWKLFGKDRSRYVAADVMSDDEDMEAGASDLEREELRSARIARKEDIQAMEEERRHEEEKRRKRKEKDRRY
ncbi:hypothetical protein C8Q72DRAFT_965721 [Fomitopsis betulina]|nr:hypothetical protein C8Q72DRAFT_965721 [Fomitopsis betulina]